MTLQGRAGTQRGIDEAYDGDRRGRRSTLALANMCCGLLGVQIVWGLQNVNTSRIFQTLGANLGELPILWIAAPITGLLVQPIIGHFSDRTWGPLGRRRPYLLVGALISGVALAVMPNVSSLFAASAMLWLLTASINVTMEPFRALIADTVPNAQRTAAFAMQVGFIGTGAVFASALPWMLAHWFGLAATAPPGALPASLHGAFVIGAVVLVASVGVTIATTRERSPESLAGDVRDPRRAVWAEGSGARLVRNGAVWLVGAGLLAAATWRGGYRSELYLIVGIAALLGLGQWATAWSARHGKRPAGLLEIVDDVLHLPPLMRRLAVVQFFTWFALFALWIYAVPAAAERVGVAAPPGSAAYNTAADWVGLLFAFYNGVAALGAFALPRMAERLGRGRTHALCLALGAVGLSGFALAPDPQWLWPAALGIGCAWSSILSLPYAMVASAVPPTRMGVYMGIHNGFVVLPQLVAAALLGWVVDRAFGGQAALALMLAAGSMAIAAGIALTLPDSTDPYRARS